MKNYLQKSLGIVSTTVCLFGALAAHNAGATVVYWDPNGATPSLTPNGNWEDTAWAPTATPTASLATFTEGVAAAFTVTNTSSGAGTNGTYTVTVNANHTVAGIFNGAAAGTSGSTNIIITGPGGLSIASGLQGFGTQLASYNTIIRTVLSGPGGLQNQNSGSLYLSANNSYSGGTIFGTSAGLNFNSGNVFGTGLISLTSASTTAVLATPATDSTGAAFATSAINVTNSVSVTNGSIIFVGVAGAPITWSGPWALPPSGTFTWQQQPAGTTATISGAISGGANFTKTGAGTTLLTGPNTYTGITTVNNGILNVNSMNKVTGGSASSALGAPTTVAAGTIALGSTTTGVTLVYSGTGETSDRVINLAGTTGGATIEQDGSGALFLSTNFTATGAGAKTLTLQGSNTGTNAIGGAIVNSSSATSLTKAQAGSWALDGTNTFTGNITISAGTLSIGGNGKLGSGSYAGTIANSGSFVYNSTAVQTLSGVISGTGSLVDSGSGTLTVSGANTYTGSTTINSGSTLTVGGSGKLGNTTMTLNGTINFSSSTAFTLTNVISGSGTMNETGSATTTLIGANTSFTGPITVTGGFLAFNNDGNLGAVPGSFNASSITLNGGASSGIRASSTSTLSANRGITLGVNGGEIQVAQNDTCTYNGVISGTGIFQDGQNTSTGLGVLVLTGVNTYTNTTTIACGTLRLSATGSIASSAGILMSNATILDVSAQNPYSLGSSTFTGIGGAATTTTILGPSGGNVNFGSQPITLSFVPSLATGDPTNAALTVSQGTLVLNGNTFNVTNASALTLGVGNYTLIQQSSGNVSATGPFTLNLFGPGIAANTSASIGVIGGSVVLQVLPTGANTSSYFTNLTANQAASYGTANATVSGTVLQLPGPVYPTNGATVNITVGTVVTNTTINDNTGDFTLTAPINTIPVGNYLLTYSSPADVTVPIGAATDTSTLLTITKVPLTVTASNQSKTYGQVITTGAGSTSFSSTGLQNGEIIGSVSLAVSGSGATATGTVAGSPYTITPSAATGGTFNAGNYSISFVTGTLTVNPASLTVTANAQSKTYGQNINFGTGSTAFTSVGLSNSETIGSVTLASSGGISNAPVSGSPYTITPSAATGGTFAIGNYSVTYNTNALTVNPATLTVTANNTSIAYGTTNAALTATYTNFVNGETLGTSDVGGSPALTTVDLSTNVPIGAYPITNNLGTLTSTNYTFSLVNGTLTITPLAVDLTGTRPYDGTNDADSSILTIANDLDGANLTLSGSALLAGSGAGPQPISDFSGLMLGGTAATNYTLTAASGSVAVTTVPISITAYSTNKIYGTAITLDPTGFTVGGTLVGTETVTAVTQASGGTAANASVSGSPYAITPSAATGINGFLAANYNITFNPGALTINPLVALLTGTRPYDGTTAAAFGILSVANVVGGDDVNLASGSGTLASAAVGTNAIASVGTLALGGTTAPDYTLAAATGSVIVTNPHTPFTITSSTFDQVGTNIVIVYQSVPGVVYQVLSSPSAAASLNTWTNEGSTVTAAGTLTTNTIPASTSGAKVYIVKDVQ